MEKLLVLSIVLVLATSTAVYLASSQPSQPLNPRGVVVFDFTKDEDAGNADWRADGAYSSFAESLRKEGYEVKSVGNGDGEINSNILQNCTVLVIPEPQERFSDSERDAIINFVKNGGGLLYIADHKSSDRNGNGWDSWRVWNENLNFDDLFGIHLLPVIAGNGDYEVSEFSSVGILTEGLNTVGIWSGTTMRTEDPARGAAYQTIGGEKYAVMAYATYVKGRVVVWGDSSTFDDGTPDPDNRGDHLHGNWRRYDDARLALNIVKWLTTHSHDSQGSPPETPVGLNATAGDSVVRLTWRMPSPLQGEWAMASRTFFTGGYGECVVSDGKSIYILMDKSEHRKALFYRYDPTSGTWHNLSAGLPGISFENGVAMAYDYSGNFYVLAGGSYRSGGDRVMFFKYNISTDSWTRLADTPHVQGAGDAIVYSGYDHRIYAFLGRAHYLGSYRPSEYGVFARYDPSSNSWEILRYPPWPGTDDGASLAWTGGRYIYALQGEFHENSPLRNFARYNIETNSWEEMSDIPAKDGVGDGGSLLWIGYYDSSYSNVIFAFDGNGCNETPGYNFSAYYINNDTWVHIGEIPSPIGYYVGNRLVYARGKLWYWQGTVDAWRGGGNGLYRYSILGSSNVTSYRVYRGTSPGGERLIAEVPAKVGMYVDRNVTNGVTYYYYVTAVNAWGESGKSREVHATPHAVQSGLLSNRILFVDDDGGSRASDYIEEALIDSGITEEFKVYKWDVYSVGYTPSLSTLLRYGIVIWSTGYAYENTLTQEDQENLMAYLDRGGRLYLSSQDFLWDISGGYDGPIDNEFANNYLGVRAVENDVSYIHISGVRGDEIGAKFGTVILDYPYHNYADEITLEPGTEGIFTHLGHYTACRHENGSYRVVFTAFSFEAVENHDATVGAEMMSVIVHWLAG